MRLLSIMLVLLVASTSKAYMIDVEWINSNPTYDTLLVAVDGCNTFFKIKKQDVANLLNNQKALNEVVSNAMSHAKTGCK